MGGFAKEAGNGLKNLRKFIAKTVVGGTISEATGGKFANGAKGAAFMSIMVASADYYKKTVGYDSDIVPGTRSNEGSDGSCCSYKPDENGRPPGSEYDVSGLNQNLEGSWLHPKNWLKQGGLIGRAVNYLLPYGKATSHFHDTVLNVDSSLSNVGTMPGAWVISALAGPGKYLRGWEQNPMVWQLMVNRPEDYRDS